MLAVTGYSSAIVKALMALIPPKETVKRVDFASFHTCIEAERWVLCAGVMTPKRGMDQSAPEIINEMRLNLFMPMAICDSVFERNARARVCVVGSESGYVGSYDDTYAAAKAALHAYVERKRLFTADQQLVAVSPGIIEDAGMTLRRKDQGNLERKRREHPKKRFLRSVEVARMIHFLLYVDEGYVSGTVVRMNGGAAA